MFTDIESPEDYYIETVNTVNIQKNKQIPPYVFALVFTICVICGLIVGSIATNFITE